MAVRSLIKYGGIVALVIIVSVISARATSKYVTGKLADNVHSLSQLHDAGIAIHHSAELRRCIDLQVAKAKEAGSLKYIKNYFSICDGKLGPIMTITKGETEVQRFAYFMTMFASHISPYGSSVADEEDDILNAAFSNCGTRSLLIARAIKRTFPHVIVKQISFFNPLLTSHGVVYVEERGKGMILDPTTRVVTTAKLDEVLRGQPVGASHIVVLERSRDENINRFRRLYQNALMHGSIRKEDVTKIKSF